MIPRLSLPVAVAAGVVLGLTSAAQALTLPAPSPRATVMQTVGVSQITVDYSSPGVKGRAVFGDVVKLGELWRTGADAPTTITLSRDAKVGGIDVKAGTYSLFTIPGADSWTVILNGNARAATRNHDAKLDVARFTVKPERVAKRERLTFLFVDTTDDATRLELEWDEVRIAIPITVDTAAHAAAEIAGHTGGAWRPLANAARYQHGVAKNHDAALALIDASIAVKEEWFNVWIKATILAETGKVRAACPLAQRAHELGSKAEYFFWKDDVEKALRDWKCKR